MTRYITQIIIIIFCLSIGLVQGKPVFAKVFGYSPINTNPSEISTARQLYFHLWNQNVPIHNISRYNGVGWTSFPSLEDFPLNPGEGFYITTFDNDVDYNLHSYIPYQQTHDPISIEFNDNSWHLIGFSQIMIDSLTNQNVRSLCEYLGSQGVTLQILYKIKDPYVDVTNYGSCTLSSRNPSIQAGESWWIFTGNGGQAHFPAPVQP